MDVARFQEQPILGIIRGITDEGLEPLLTHVASAGLKTIEITMNTSGAPQLIRRAVKFSGKQLTIGAGTVLDVRSLKTALDAGASFIVMPVLVRDVMSYCVKHRVPVFPGALTPSEIYEAWRAGATMVKVFPTNFFGPKYFREIKGPFQNVKLLACGGVTPENLGEYFDHGADAISFGSSVFKPEWMTQKKSHLIGRLIKSYIRAFTVFTKQARPGIPSR